MRFGIVVFPGSNCDEDAFHAARDVFGQDAEYLWHKDTDVKGADVLILPGGFAHGDYLRTGAMARFSPIMPAVRAVEMPETTKDISADSTKPKAMGAKRGDSIDQSPLIALPRS